MSTAIAKTEGLMANLAQSASLDPIEFEKTLKATVMPNGVTNEQFTAFLMVAEKYDLNPITKEIYAFPARGGITPIVSIDGWIKLINNRKEFDGMEFQDHVDNGKLTSVTCKIFRKDRSHATEVTEYLAECDMGTQPWKKYPARMLRHKAAIQAARYAFGFSRISDPDEGERIADSQPTITEEKIVEQPTYSQSDFDEQISKYGQAITDGRKTVTAFIDFLETKAKLTEEMKQTIMNLEPKNEEEIA